MKKILTTVSLVVMVALVCALCSCSLLGGSKLTFVEEGDGYAVTGRGDDTNTALEIPAEYKGKPVVAIGMDAFAVGYMDETPQIQSVTIPDTVKTIGSGAFQSCKELTSVVIPEGVTVINQYTFADCTSLTSVTLPSTITKIGQGAFAGCSSLASINIPASVTIIDTQAFEGCSSLGEITLPDGLIAIGIDTFGGCTNLKVSSLPDSLLEIADYAFEGCTALTGELTIPSTTEILGKGIFNETSEDLVVNVSYDTVAPENWNENWHGGMAGKAINTSEAYYQNVVVPNQEATKGLQESLEALRASYESYNETIEGMVAVLNAMKSNASINPSDYLLQNINDYQRQIQDVRNSQNDLGRLISEKEEELKAYKITNQLN